MKKKKEESHDTSFTDQDTSPKKQKVKKTKKKKQKQPIEEPEPTEEQLEMDESFESATTPTKGTPKGSKKKQKAPQQQDDTSSEEERWLEAIESGKLEEVDDELKKIKPKDPKLMTARQRAMYEKNINETNPTSPTNKFRKSLPSTTIVDGVQANVSSSGQLLLALPNFKIKKEKEKQPLTAEDIEKSKEKAQKRKQLADEKREKDKKKTMERLLKKQDSKTVKSTKLRPNKHTIPVISYKNSRDGIYLSYPPNLTFPLQPKTAIEPPKMVLCGISGCKNPKRYRCSKTNIPLCSLECYKKNVESVKQMIF